MRDWFRRNGLVRPRRGRVLGGVCAAFAQRFGWNKWLVRLAAVLSIVIPGPQLLGYVVLWILMPEEKQNGGRAG